MVLSAEDAYQEFESEIVQTVIRSIGKKLGTNFNSIELKGWGGQGLIVYLECFAYNHKICAKIPHCNAFGKHAILKEAQINEALTSLNVSYVPRLLCYSEDGEYLVREYLDGSLLDTAIRNATLEERIRLAYLEWEMVTQAFSIVHEHAKQPYVIRDLKAKNIILSPKKDKLYLIDLGSCRREDNMVSRRRFKMWKRFGSGQFLHWPLEQLVEDKTKCSRKVDYFAFGVLLYETLFNHRPYSNTEKIISIAKKIYEEEYEVAKYKIQKALESGFVPTELAELMIHTLHPDSEERYFIVRQ
ncbi:TPA: protein kinase [Streptococcus suis]